MEASGGDGSETGLVMKKKGWNRRPVSASASARTTGIKTTGIGATLSPDYRDKDDRYRRQPQPGLQG